MQISRKTEYAIRAALYLTLNGEQAPIMTADIAAGVAAPENYLSNILQSLTRFNIVRAHRGAQRGYSLAVPATEINLLQIVEALEGPVGINCCSTVEPGCCPLKTNCCVSDVFRDLQKLIRDHLSGSSLADAAERSDPTGSSDAPGTGMA